MAQLRCRHDRRKQFPASHRTRLTEWYIRNKDKCSAGASVGGYSVGRRKRATGLQLTQNGDQVGWSHPPLDASGTLTPKTAAPKGQADPPRRKINWLLTENRINTWPSIYASGLYVPGTVGKMLYYALVIKHLPQNRRRTPLYKCNKFLKFPCYKSYKPMLESKSPIGEGNVEDACCRSLHCCVLPAAVRGSRRIHQ
jgi:hypothetical protein